MNGKRSHRNPGIATKVPPQPVEVSKFPKGLIDAAEAQSVRLQALGQPGAIRYISYKGMRAEIF
jgi:hypothetical protein